MADTVGFYAVLPSSDGKGQLGALLVTDEIGKPEEFRVTYPVKPTLVQKQLYGDSLFPHVGVELCGAPLYESLRNKPDVLLVSDERLLLLSRHVSCPVVHASRLGDTLQVKAGDAPARGTLKSSLGRFNPIGLSFPAEYGDDDRRGAQELLERFFEHIDLLEPFDRITAAVKELAAQNTEFA